MRRALTEQAASALFWSALPLIAAQGWWLRRRAPRFPAAAGEPAGTVGTGRPLRLLALGDSIIAGVAIERIEDALPGQFARALAAASGRQVTWRALGRNGATAGDSLQRLRAHPAALADCELLLVSTGVNDVTGLRSRRRFARDLAAIAAVTRRTSPNCRMLFAGVPPLQAFPLLPAPLRQLLGLRAAALDRRMAVSCAQLADALHVGAPFAPGPERFAADGFHPHATACAAWAEALAAHCLQRWPQLADIDNPR